MTLSEFINQTCVSGYVRVQTGSLEEIRKQKLTEAKRMYKRSRIFEKYVSKRLTADVFNANALNKTITKIESYNPCFYDASCPSLGICISLE